MPLKNHTWINVWIALTIPVIFWDTAYCFMRPRSMTGGDLHWIWKPYEIYENVDYIYGWPAFNENDGFPNAQSLLNVIENLLNMLYLYLTFSTSTPSPVAPLLGFTTAAMTLAKTALYWAQEYYCGYCSIGQNTALDLVRYWIVPNGLWIVVPSAIVWTLGKELKEELEFAAGARKAGLWVPGQKAALNGKGKKE